MAPFGKLTSMGAAEKSQNRYRLLGSERNPIKAWIQGVPIEATAEQQLRNIASLPFIYRWISAMPDVHWGIGATIGSVIPTTKAIIPAAVGVDLGCGMMAVRTSLRATDLPDSLARLRSSIERAVPHGSSKGKREVGAWRVPPSRVIAAWTRMRKSYEQIVEKHPSVRGKGNEAEQLGTLGGGNHFIEVCLDEADRVWVMLHSGSRGVGNRLGTYFIELAKVDMHTHLRNLPDQNLAYLEEGTESFRDYVDSVEWAQQYAMTNRLLMMEAVLEAVRETPGIPPFTAEAEAINCHHNYVAREEHYGREVWVTRKGAVRAREGDLGIIPGSMGARSFIVRGKGSAESFHSCSHGAGRLMSRGEAKRRFSVSDHARATEGIECRKDAQVIDETPAAYKDIDAVMAAQSDLVEVLHALRQVVVVKG